MAGLGQRAESDRELLDLSGLDRRVPDAVQVIWLTARVTWLRSSSVSGLASFEVVTCTVRPGTGIVDTDTTGRLVGRYPSTLVVDAVSLSVGTRKATRAYPPLGGLVGVDCDMGLCRGGEPEHG